jgi:hypothetical protein
MSYGWVDHGALRIIFRRSYIGNDGLGRPGNFCAHMLVGTRETLPAVEVVRRFSSPFWWTGEDADRFVAGDLSLKPVELSDIPPDVIAEVDAGLLASLTETLLSPRPRLPLVLRCPPEQTVALLTAVAERLPGSLEAMPFSTYESPTKAVRFHVVGTTGPGIPVNATAVPTLPSPAHPEPVRRARDLILSGVPGDRSLVMMCVAASDERGGPASIARLGTLIDLFDQLRRGAQIDKSAVAAALGRPSAAEFLLEIPAAIEMIADDLISAQPTFWSSLRTSASGISKGKLTRLGAAVGTRAARQGSPVLLNQVIAAADQLPGSFAPYCATAALSQASDIPDLLERLAPLTILSMIRHGVATDLSRTDRGISALLAASGAYPIVADAVDIPPSWRGIALGHALIRTPSIVPMIADRLSIEPNLAESLTAVPPVHDQLIAVLSRVARVQLVPCVLAAGTNLPIAYRIELAVWCADKLTSRDRLGFLIKFAYLIPAWESTHSWAHLVAFAVERYTADTLQTLNGNPVPSSAALSLLAQAGLDCAASWNKLVDHLSSMQRCGRADAFNDWVIRGLEIVGRGANSGHRGTQLDLLLFVALRRPVSWASFERIAAQLNAGLLGGPEDTAIYLLTAASRAASWNKKEVSSSLHCLVYIAQLIDRGNIDIKSTGQIRNRRLNGLTVNAFRSLPNNSLDKVADSISASCRTKAPSIWWASISRSPLQRLHAWRK